MIIPNNFALYKNKDFLILHKSLHKYFVALHINKNSNVGTTMEDVMPKSSNESLPHYSKAEARNTTKVIDTAVSHFDAAHLQGLWRCMQPHTRDDRSC